MGNISASPGLNTSYLFPSGRHTEINVMRFVMVFLWNFAKFMNQWSLYYAWLFSRGQQYHRWTRSTDSLNKTFWICMFLICLKDVRMTSAMLHIECMLMKPIGAPGKIDAFTSDKPEIGNVTEIDMVSGRKWNGCTPHQRISRLQMVCFNHGQLPISRPFRKHRNMHSTLSNTIWKHHHLHVHTTNIFRL